MLKKRLFSLLLVVSMLLTWLPTAAAVTFDPLGEGPVRYLVDGVTRSSSLQTAWNAAVAANSGATITLRQDLTGENGSLGTGAGFRSGALLVPKGKKITLDLAGRKLDRQLTAPAADGSVLVVEGELVLKDSNGAARGAIMGGNSTTSGGGITVAGGGTLTIEGGNITGNISQLTGAGGIDNRGTVVMSGGKVTANRGGGFRQDGSLKLSGMANISGNTDTANLYLPANKTAAVTGTLTQSTRVGVTTEQLPSSAGSLPVATGSVSEAYVEKIVADQSTLYKTAFEDGRIVIRNLVDHAPYHSAPQAQSSAAPQAPAAASSAQNSQAAQPSVPEVPVQVSFYLNYVTSGGSANTITVVAGRTYGRPQSGLFPPDPTRDGYVFDGWYTSASNGQGVKVTRDTVVTNTNAHSLYAHWKAGQVSVFFDAQGGTVSPASTLVSIGEPYGTLPVPQREGRKFLGWYTTPEGGQEVTAASIVKQQYSHTLYAMWGAEAKPWLVSFHNLDESGNDAIFIDATGTDGRMTLPSPAACGFSTPEGKSFAGWSSSWNGPDLTPAGASMTFTQNGDLYAVWQSGHQDTQDTSGTPTGAEYTVTYLLDGTIEGEAVVESREENKTFQLMDNPTVKSGYHFVGWSNEGKIYKVNESFQMPSHDVTFTAVWEAGEVDTVTVSFDANYEGAPPVSPASKEVTIGQKYGTLPSPAREGYRFDGWYTEAASDQGVLITADDIVRFTSSHILYAHWTNTSGQTKKYAITLKGNGGTVNGKDEDVFYRDEGEAYSDGLVVPKRAGYGFIGWFDGDEIVGASTPATRDTILDAHWKEGAASSEESGEGFLITFDANDDSGRQFTRRTEADGWMDLPACEFDPPEPDMVFDVWTLDTQNEYRMSNRFRFKNDAIIYARWKHPGDTVADPPATQSLKNQQAQQELMEKAMEQSSSEDTTVREDAAATQAPETAQSPEPSPSQNEAAVNTMEEEPPAETQETPPAASAGYTITLKANGGTGDDKTVQTNENGELTAAPACEFTAPLKEDGTAKVFRNWAHDAGGENPLIYPQKFSSETSIYAIWTDAPAEYTVHFDPNGGTSGGTDDESYMADLKTGANGSLFLPECRFVPPENMKFKAWALGSADGRQCEAGSYQVFSADTTLYAVWMDASATLSDTRYNVIFYRNDGTEAASVVTYRDGETYNARWGANPTRTGYTFTGWLDGQGSAVSGDLKVADSTPKTLYAGWLQVPDDPAGTACTVVFNDNYEGGNTTAPVPAHVGDTYGSVCTGGELPTPTRTGYTFTGWYTRPDGGARILKDTALVNAGENVAYALWRAEGQKTVTFQSGEGSGGDYVLVSDAEGMLTLPKPEALGMTAPTGKSFLGWQAAAALYKAGDSVKLTDDTTLTASWGSAYKITYELPYGIGSGTMADGQAFPNTPFTLPECGFTPPAGYRFNGWSIGYVTAAQVPAGSAYTFTADTTIYATWIMTDGGDSGASGSGSSGGGASHPIWDGNSKPGSSSNSNSNNNIGGRDDDTDSEKVIAQVILNASAGTGGTISPSGQVRVERGRDQEFTITASDGYVIADVVVDNNSVGAVSRYTFDGVQRAHTIQATFTPSAAQTETAADTAAVDTADAAASGGSGDYLGCAQDTDCPITFYSDIVSNGWYHDGVHYCLDSGLMSGTTASRFEPEAKLTRAMLAQILYNQAERPSVSGGSSFSDVVSGAWYEDAVTYAASTGLVAGYESGGYGPNDPITREQLVVVLWRHAGSPASGVSVPLSDFFDTRAYADEAMRWAYGRGIISGKSDGLLDPSGQATRVEVAQMLKSYFA